jgi:Xaa-Pro aminopeptidase
MVFDLKKIHGLMQEKGIDCVIATSRENVFYSAGVWAGISLRPAPVILPLDADPVILVHPSGSGAGEDITVRKTSWIEDVRTYQGGEWAPLRVWDAVAEVMREKGLQESVLGLEVFEVAGKCYDHIREQLPSAKFTGCESVFDELRSVKSDEELKILTDGNVSTAKAVSQAFEVARPGVTEASIARDIMEHIMDSGASRIAFLSLAAGSNVLEPHHAPSDYEIKSGDLVHVDVGGVWRGYLSDISRMAVVGKPSDRQRRAYEVIIRQMWDTAEAMERGATVNEVNDAAKRSYESNGFKYPRFFIGHSIGLKGHEHPFLAPFHGDWILEPSMVFQLEPSHVDSNDIRVHYEDSFVIQEDGPAKNVSEYENSWELPRIK